MVTWKEKDLIRLNNNRRIENEKSIIKQQITNKKEEKLFGKIGMQFAAQCAALI